MKRACVCVFSYLKLINVYVTAGNKMVLENCTKRNQNTRNTIKHATQAIIVSFALAFKHRLVESTFEVAWQRQTISLCKSCK